MILTINGVDKTSLLQKNTLDIDDTLNSRNTATFNLVDELGAYRPISGQEVIFSDGEKKFAGTIDDIEEEQPKGSNALKYTLNCVDYNQICDRYTVPAVYEDMTMGAIVKDIIDNYLPGENITYVNVEDGPTIIKAVFQYDTVTKVFNDLSDLTGYDWYIDYDKDLHFFARETNLAPFVISNANNNYSNVKVRDTREQYRNRQYVRAGYGISIERTDAFRGDGESQTFVCKLPLAQMPTVKVNSVIKTVGIRTVESGKDWYWSKKEKEVTQESQANALTSSDKLEVIYQGLYPIIARVDKPDEIAARASIEGGNGVYENIEQDESIESTDAAQEKASALLRRYGEIPQIVTFQTEQDGLKAGQLLTINITEHGLNDTYLTKNVKLNDLTSSTYVYQVTALSGENIGGWIDFFKKLTLAGRQYVIRENEVLLRLLQFRDGLSVNDSFIVSSPAPESRIGYVMIGFSEIG